MIYVIVKVSYDHYRFQENLDATCQRNEAKRIAKLESDIREVVVREYLPESPEQMALDRDETPHIWIQDFQG